MSVFAVSRSVVARVGVTTGRADNWAVIHSPVATSWRPDAGLVGITVTGAIVALATTWTREGAMVQSAEQAAEHQVRRTASVRQMRLPNGRSADSLGHEVPDG